MRGPIHRLLGECGGVAAAETAIVAPFLLIIAFGAGEIGHLFWDQHVLSKAVRDGARYAARQPFASYDMSACTLSSTAEANTRRLVRTAQLASAGQLGLLPNWNEADEASTIDIEVNCDNSGTYTGIYSMNGNVAARVRVQASVPYTPLMGGFPLISAGSWTLVANSEAAVTGS